MRLHKIIVKDSLYNKKYIQYVNVDRIDKVIVHDDGGCLLDMGGNFTYVDTPIDVMLEELKPYENK